MDIKCENCKHQETELCNKCPLSKDSDARCYCNATSHPPCGFCEACQFEEK